MDEGLSLFLALRVRGYKGLWLGVTTVGYVLYSLHVCVWAHQI
jgi:hypothetical protein